MIQFLDFMFSGFWTFIGMMMLISVASSLVLGLVKWFVVLVRGYK